MLFFQALMTTIGDFKFEPLEMYQLDSLSIFLLEKVMKLKIKELLQLLIVYSVHTQIKKVG